MGAKDVAGPAKTVSATLTYDQKDLYNYFNKWFEERHYDVTEKDYKERITGDGKRVFTFNWECEKEVEDYTKLFINVSFKAEVENVKIETHDGKSKTAQKGEVTATFQAFVERDADDEWQLTKEKATQHLMREVYDKMIAKGRLNRYNNQLSKDMDLVMSDLKTYLKTHRYD